MELVTDATRTRKAKLLTRGFRIITRGTCAGWCVLACLLELGAHVVIGRRNAQTRARVLQKWSARLLSSIGVRIEVNGNIPEPGLIVSNHLSYLDILVFSAVAGCIFVAKREVKSWPGVGWISSLSGTIYIDRGRRAETHAIQSEMQSALSNGTRLVLFPEGTSSDGSEVMHFHSSLFQAALEVGACITAAAISYSIPNGDAAREACYWGNMMLLPHLLNLLTKESVQVRLKFSREHLQFSDRKEAARTMRFEVERLREVPAARG